MFHIFVLIALAASPSDPIDVLKSRTTFDTVEACEAQRPVDMETLKPQAEQAGVVIINSVCADSDEAAVEKLTANEDK